MKKIFGLLLVSSLLMGQTAMAQQRRGGTVRKTTTTTRKPATAPAPVQLKNPDEALIAKAQEGDAEAQYQLGLLYFNGQGIIHSWTEAIKWFRLSADQGNANALYQLGLLYEQSKLGYIGNPSPETVMCFRMAAERGNADAQFKIGKCYKYGEGVEKSETEAVKWYRNAAEQGHPGAQIMLGILYDDSDKILSEKWFKLGLEQYRKLAAQGNADAQFKLAECYEYGFGVEDSETEAEKWYNLGLAQYRKLAAQGNADAQFKLAECYEYGNGVEESDSEAAKWYRKAAEQGHVQAQYQLGLAYNIGSGVEESETEATKWYLKAAEQGHADAMCWIGDEYAREEIPDGVKWLVKAAEQGHVKAMTGAGIYTHGVESVKWYKRAAKRGDEFAIKQLKKLGITDYEESQEFIPSSNFVHSKYCEAESVKYFMYPTREWGCSKDEVKDFMAGYSIYIDKENDYIIFSGKYRETKTTYYFTKNGSLSSVVITIPNGRWDQAALMQTILKDYIFVAKDSKEDTYMFNCKDNKSCLNLSFREKENDAIIYLLP